MGAIIETSRAAGEFTTNSIEERWVCDVLPGERQEQDQHQVNTIYLMEADEVHADIGLWEATYHFQRTTRWEAIKARRLNRIGWRPDCSREPQFNLDEASPAIFRTQRLVVLGNSGKMHALTAEELRFIQELNQRISPVLK